MENSEALINEITLSCLINKNQLLKLRKNKLKSEIVNSRQKFIELHYDKLKNLFVDLLDGNPPENFQASTIEAFEHFIDKCIFYVNVKLSEEEQEQQEKEERMKREEEEEKSKELLIKIVKNPREMYNSEEDEDCHEMLFVDNPQINEFLEEYDNVDEDIDNEEKYYA